MTKGQIIRLLRAKTPALLKRADALRAATLGPAVHLRALIEISNYCKQNCHYCGLRCANKKIKRYRMSPAQITALAARAKKWGFKTIVLQSGEDAFYTPAKLGPAIAKITAMGMAVTLSLGELSFDDLKALCAAGAQRYLLRLETGDKKLYAALHPGASLQNRLRCLRDLKKLGYEVGSGLLVGLPGQSIESLASDLLYLQTLPVDMAGIGPFIPAPNTPLAAAKSGANLALSLRVMAVMRLLRSQINIPATTAMESLQTGGRRAALKAGANVVMLNITPAKYADNYKIYPGKLAAPAAPAATRAALARELKTIQRTIGRGRGNSRSYAPRRTRAYARAIAL